MNRANWPGIAGLSVLIVTLASGSAVAQVSLVGEWSLRYHEDQPDRIPGPTWATRDDVSNPMLDDLMNGGFR